MTTIPSLTAAVAVALGAKAWTHPKTGETRYYFNDLNSLYGLSCQYYKTGNISSASLNGVAISNSQARKIETGLALTKVWLDNDGLHVQASKDVDGDRLMAEITRRANELAAPAPTAPRFTADLNRRAWAIRREAAARFGVKVTAISWAECLKLARA